LFDDEDAIVRIDMSEYMEKHSVSRLVGAPPGYVGYDEGGQLTEAIRRKPYSVILLDEIEKAHPDVFNVLLQVLDDGRLTDSQGRVVDFKNTVIIMTSNLGCSGVKGISKLGFSNGLEAKEDVEFAKTKNRIVEELKHTFRPEFLNRIDETIVFHPLNKDHIKNIVDLMLKDLHKRLEEQEMELVVSDLAKEKLIDEGYDPEYGARPLRRAIQRLVEDPLAEELLRQTFVAGNTVYVNVAQNEIVLEKEAQKEEVIEIEQVE